MEIYILRKHEAHAVPLLVRVDPNLLAVVESRLSEGLLDCFGRHTIFEFLERELGRKGEQTNRQGTRRTVRGAGSTRRVKEIRIIAFLHSAPRIALVSAALTKLTKSDKQVIGF
jgi:hypothetical protein